MKKSSRIISAAMAALMISSTAAVGAVTASAATLKKPAKVKAVNTKKGIKISWKKAKDAKKYRVYRGKKLIKTTTKKSYVDKKVKNGSKYTYKVKAVNGKKTKTSKKVNVYRIKAPTSVKTAIKSNGINVSWSLRFDSKYQIYRKAAGGKYKLIKTVAAYKTDYTDTTVANGKKYSYKVKAYIGKSVSIASSASAKTYVAPVKNIKADVKASGTTTTAVISWDKNTAATSYKVYRGDINNKKTLVAATTKTTYTAVIDDANPRAYSYFVVAVKGSASAEAGVSVLHLPEGCYFTDAEGNKNVNLTFNVGDEYIEGAYLYNLINLMSYVDSSIKVSAEVVEGKDVVKLDNYKISALSAGTAKIKITYSEAAAKKFKEILDGINATKKLSGEAAAGTAYVNVTVKGSSVAGSWESKESAGTVYTFNEDGTGSLAGTGYSIAFTYKIKDASIVITYNDSGAAQTYRFAVENNVLSLTDDFNATIKYTKR